MLFEIVKMKLGGVDALVNNAGVTTSSLPLKDIDASDFWFDFVGTLPIRGMGY